MRAKQMGPDRQHLLGRRARRRRDRRPYHASKAGMEGLTRGYAARLVKEGITVNAVTPSLIKTDMVGGRHLSRAPSRWAASAGRGSGAGSAMVIGNAYMTGQTIVLNGGMAFI